MRVYKLSTQSGLTHGGTQWGPGVRHEATGNGKDLCSDGWIHAYEDKYVAALLNPIHANFANPQCWIAEGEGTPKRDGQEKLGFKAMTTVRRTKLPVFSTNQRVAFAIYCALALYSEPSFVAWAKSWLDGLERSSTAAEAAAEVAAGAAAWAAGAAAWAAEAAAEVATAAPAWVAQSAAQSAAGAAARVADLPHLARQAYRFERGES